MQSVKGKSLFGGTANNDRHLKCNKKHQEQQKVLKMLNFKQLPISIMSLLWLTLTYSKWDTAGKI